MIFTVLSSVENGRRVVEIFLALYKIVSLSAPRIMASSNSMAEKIICILTEIHNTQRYEMYKYLFSYLVGKTFQLENVA
jgi:hypothetical protein